MIDCHIRLGHPRTNIRQFSRPNNSAKASPSMGAYLLSESLVNRDPAKVVFQSVPQNGLLISRQLQCFCDNVKPMPVLRAVFLQYNHHEGAPFCWHPLREGFYDP